MWHEAEKACPQEEGAEVTMRGSSFWAHLLDVKLFIAVCCSGIGLLAQMPIRVDVYTHPQTPPPDYVGPVYRALEQGVDTAARIRQSQIEQGWLDLARKRERRMADVEQESRRLQDRVLDQNFGYLGFREGAATWKINQEVMDAFSVARKRHTDFDSLLPAMRIVADSLRPQWGKINMGNTSSACIRS